MEPEREAQYTQLREAYRASEERRLVVAFVMGAKTYRVFLGNEVELRMLLVRSSKTEAALELWNLENRPAFDAFLDEVDRLLHNYLASVGSLRDHTRTLWQTYLPQEEYAEKVRTTFAESGLCVFVQNLRNFTLHANLPLTQGHMSWEQGGEVKTGVQLHRSDLQRWTKWPPLAKQYLAELPQDGIDLLGLVADYTETVTRFNDWFGETFVDRCADAFKRVREMENELSRLFPGSFQPRPKA
jgi:hypothetical protein